MNFSRQSLLDVVAERNMIIIRGDNEKVILSLRINNFNELQTISLSGVHVFPDFFSKNAFVIPDIADSTHMMHASFSKA